MSIEKFTEIPEYIEAHKDSEDVKKFLNGFSSLDVFKNKINDPDFKSFIDSEKDKHSSKSLETWKTNNLQKLIDEAVKKANPTETDEQKKIRELTERIDKAEKEKTHESLRNKALKIASEKKLPSELVDYFIGQDEESTNKNLENLETVLNAKVNALAEERLKGGYKPPKGNENLSDTEQAQAEINKIFGLK